MVVCEFCQATIYWSEDDALHLGTRSVLPEGDTRLFMGATGKLMGRGFQVVGHVRLEHLRGSWDEWYLQIDGKKAAWVSEGGREMVLARTLKVDEAPADPAELQVGFRINLSGREFSIREIDKATCVGGEGQLPFTLLPGEEYPYMDIATLDGKHSATLEYDEEGLPHAYLGQPLSHDQLTVDDERPSVAASQEGKDVDCPNCGAPLEKPNDRDVCTLVCTYCGARLDLTGAEANVMGVNPEKVKPNFLLEIGQAGNLLGSRYEVSGRLMYRDAWGFESREYILFHPDKGYLWLAEENGHFVLSRPTKQAPSIPVFDLPPKHPVKIGEKTFLFFEECSVHIVYVDGSLPWVANANDAFKSMVLIAPPKQFSIERDGQDLQYFAGDYMTSAQIWEAFGLKDDPWEARGVHAAQPFVEAPTAKPMLWMGLLFALANLLLLVWSSVSEGERLHHAKLRPEEYGNESLSDPFSVGSGGIMCLKISAPVVNRWATLDVALVNDKDEVVTQSGGEVSYYKGGTGSDRWSEGSQSQNVFFRAPPAGTYRLLLKGSSGAEKGTALVSSAGPSIKVDLFQGQFLSRYFLFTFVAALLLPLYLFLQRRLFEQRRWISVTEDDDDETDWDDFD